MTPKEISNKFTEIFGLDFHDYYDEAAWRTKKVIKLDIWKFEAWFVSRFPNINNTPLYKKLEYQYGSSALEFVKSIV